MSQPDSRERNNAPTPRRVRISSKRQITIPVDIYERHGFTEYALLTETSDGLQIQPFKLTNDDEELTLMLLRYLMDNGYEGDALLQKYQEIKPLFADAQRGIERSRENEKPGQTMNPEDIRQKLKELFLS